MTNVNCNNIGCVYCVDGMCMTIVVNMTIDDKTGFSMCTSYKHTRKDDPCWVGM